MSILTQQTPRPLSHRLARFFYRAAWWVLSPGLGYYLRRRARRGKEDQGRISERYGMPSHSRDADHIIWVHGASVGESLSALPVIEHILNSLPNVNVLVTTGTITSANVLSERLPSGSFHQYIPLDHPAYVNRFLSYWNPSTVLWLESEFWPNLIVEASKRKIPMALVNARVSDASFKSWKRNRWAIEPILQGFRVSLAQDDDVAQKLTALGAQNVATIGNLKYASAPLPNDEVQLADLRKAIGTRPIWLAAQTIAPEEEVVLQTHLALAKIVPDLITIIVPRHPERGPEILDRISQSELKVSVRSRSQDCDATTDIYLADTMGDLGLFFRLAEIVFLGRSLVPLGGGSNLLEPARLGCSVVQGPYTENFAEVSERFISAEAVAVVKSEDDLLDVVTKMFDDPDYTHALAARAQSVADDAASVLDKVVDAVMPLLPNSEVTRADT